MVLNMAGKKINFLIDTGDTYSVLISHTGLLSSKSCTVTGVDRKPHTHYFSGPLTCQCEQRLISHSFSVVPECPTPLHGRDFLASLGAILQLGDPKQPLFLTLRQISWKNKGLFPAIFYTKPCSLGQRNPWEGYKCPTYKN